MAAAGPAEAAGGCLARTATAALRSCGEASAAASRADSGRAGAAGFTGVQLFASAAAAAVTSTQQSDGVQVMVFQPVSHLSILTRLNAPIPEPACRRIPAYLFWCLHV